MNLSISEKIEYKSLTELKKVAEKIVAFADNLKVWTFEGEMGAGKTTLIKAICECFNVEDSVSSPTFSLVNEYHSIDNRIFYHFDFYRLKDESEALDIGIEEYFDSDNYCFLEWPSKISSLIPHSVLSVNITVEGDKRVIHLFKNSKGLE